VASYRRHNSSKPDALEQQSENVTKEKCMKLTPVELALDPVCVPAGENHYNFSTQRREGVSPSLASTYAGTQTHNNQGRPVDKDND
jgi:hypothetical protein